MLDGRRIIAARRVQWTSSDARGALWAIQAAEWERKAKAAGISTVLIIR